MASNDMLWYAECLGETAHPKARAVDNALKCLRRFPNKTSVALYGLRPARLDDVDVNDLLGYLGTCLDDYLYEDDLLVSSEGSARFSWKSVPSDVVQQFKAALLSALTCGTDFSEAQWQAAGHRLVVTREHLDWDISEVYRAFGCSDA